MDSPKAKHPSCSGRWPLSADLHDTVYCGVITVFFSRFILPSYHLSSGLALKGLSSPVSQIECLANQFFELSPHFYEFRKQPLRGVLKKRGSEICSKFTREQSCQSVISIKLQTNFIEIALRHGCSPVNLLHIFRTSFSRNTSGWLLLDFELLVLIFQIKHFIP